MEAYYQELIQEAKKRNIQDPDTLAKLSMQIGKKYKTKEPASFIKIMLHAKDEDLKHFSFLVSKPSRTLSGVAPVAVMTKPLPCPHGRCTYCPGGPKSFFGDVPQSYTGNEPSTMRAMRSDYDPYRIVFNRLEQYALLNQNFDKTELIIQGGTFTAFPIDYQEEVITYSLKAMNDFGEHFMQPEINHQKFKQFFELPGDKYDDKRAELIKQRILALKNSSTLETEQKRNETSKVRCVAMAIETKPDWCKIPEINQMLKLGCTRVEVGAQTVYDEVLEKIHRGHTVQDTIEATQLMKDSFLKVGYHIMPGLPLTNKEQDINMIQEFFENENFKPDFAKLYPCMVMPGTVLHAEYKMGKYKPLSTEEAADIIAEGKRYIPEYCRIMRVQRDIPTKVTIDGVGITNLRQLTDKKLEEKGLQCRCIRCREPKSKEIQETLLKRFNYKASGGEEIFLSIEDPQQDILVGFCRLRIPNRPFRPEITEGSAGIRELHVYSKSLGIGKQGSSLQHKGFGKMLMAEAEKIAKEEYGCKKMIVISGIGVREYFKKLGYAHDGPYMSKPLS